MNGSLLIKQGKKNSLWISQGSLKKVNPLLEKKMDTILQLSKISGGHKIRVVVEKYILLRTSSQISRRRVLVSFTHFLVICGTGMMKRNRLRTGLKIALVLRFTNQQLIYWAGSHQSYFPRHSHQISLVQVS